MTVNEAVDAVMAYAQGHADQLGNLAQREDFWLQLMERVEDA